MPADAMPASLWKSRGERGVYAERKSEKGEREEKKAKRVRGDRDRKRDGARDKDAEG